MFALLLASLALADCPESATSTDLAEGIKITEQSFREFDLNAFRRNNDDLAFLVPCLEMPISPSLAARYHRLQGIVLFVEKQDEAAVASFAAARNADDAIQLDGLVPSGHATLDLFGRFDLGEARFDTIPVPRAGALLFDGTASQSRPRSFPTLMQVLDESGDVVSTGYLLPSDPAVDYDTTPAPQKPEPGGQSSKGIDMTGVAIAGGAGAVGVVAAVLYGTAAASANNFQNEEKRGFTEEDFQSQRASVNALVVTSGVLGAASAAGVGVGLVWAFK